MKHKNGSRRTKTVWTGPMLFLTALLLLPFAATAQESSGSAAGGPPSESAKSGEATVRVAVFYATNRRHDEGKLTADSYGGDRGEPHFGRCEVEFTPIPFLDRVGAKAPFYLPSETYEVSVVEKVNARTFRDRLAAAVERTSSGSVVVFVHGFNYGFERTCRMAAEIQRKLQGKATLVMFSWPSNGLPSDYMRDQADLEWSVPFLTRVLAQLGNRLGPGKVQVLAHSLGSRGAVFALGRLGAESDERPVIGRLVLLAPDFDSQTFVELLPGLLPLAGGITLYASSNDTVLKLSRQLNGYPRLGEAGDYLTVAEGMETIDVSPGGRYQIFGHEYFYFHPKVAADLATLLSSGASAAERSELRSRTRDGLLYWQIVGDSTL